MKYRNAIILGIVGGLVFGVVLYNISIKLMILLGYVVTA
jgi:hypothetical protein